MFNAELVLVGKTDVNPVLNFFNKIRANVYKLFRYYQGSRRQDFHKHLRQRTYLQ